MNAGGWTVASIVGLVAAMVTASHAAEPVGPGQVKVWSEPMVIPTYPMGEPDLNPMFYTGEFYQGAQRRVYPYALRDELSHEREDRTYTALHLENGYISLIVLPEIGGRLFAATDKTNGYDFFYRQHVIKPALVGMLGAWISGGVEFCAFHHHRNTTFMPVDYHLSENEDGSATIFFGEIERRDRMKWLVGLTLRPDRAYVEVTVRLANRTPMPHSMLYWENAAVHVNQDYQVIFPPSVNVTTHHAKIDFTHWPVSQGQYRGQDYTGKDISWFKNLPSPVSFFAWNLQEDFMGGYDHGRDAGVVHVGDHHVLPGAKLWSWGHGAAGKLWENILTDEDGPYVELMVGAYSDNQPDYSWIEPYEVRTFTHYWYPVHGIGGFKYANRDGAVNLEVSEEGVATFGFHCTSGHLGARARLTVGSSQVCDETIDIHPGEPFRHSVKLPADTPAGDVRVALIADGRELLACCSRQHETAEELPAPVEPPPAPDRIATTEELYLTGLRIEQIHNPSVDPCDYYREAIRRDPDDVRCRTRLGMHANWQGRFEEAEAHLKRAIARMTAGYTRPRDGEPLYQLGLAQRAHRQYTAAIDSFAWASWDQACRAPAQLQMAEIYCMGNDHRAALERIDRSLAANALNARAICVKSIILRHLGRFQEAASLTTGVLRADPLNTLAANERYLALEAAGQERAAREVIEQLRRTMRDEVEAYLELACDYIACGQWFEARDVLQRPVDLRMAFASTYPLVHYYLGYVESHGGDTSKAARHIERAATMPADYCFPFRLETIDVLQAAVDLRPEDARAWYYLGNVWFERWPQRAIECWQTSARLDDAFALTHRNLGWASYRVNNDVPQAIAHYERAVAVERDDPRLFLELDRLYEIGNVEPERRLATLAPNHDVIRRNQDALLREVLVLVLAGRPETALDYLHSRFFHAREGGKDIHEVYADAHVLIGLRCLAENRPSEALTHFEQAGESPANLSASPSGWRVPQLAYLSGLAHEAAGDLDKATAAYERGAQRKGNSNWPQSQYYHALCLGKDGDEEAANQVFDSLIETGRQRLTPVDTVDYFAKFGEQETRQARIAHAHFMIALGHLGKHHRDEARTHLAKAVELNQALLWARYHLSVLERE